MKAVSQFVFAPKALSGHFTAISLCSGAGLSDIGYRLAGFRFIVQCELNAYRANIGKDNFPESEWVVGDLRKKWKEIVHKYRAACDQELDLLVVTPPCQGMSSSNPSRGKRTSLQARKNEEKNTLVLAITPVVTSLSPRIIVAENIRQLLTLPVGLKTDCTVVDLLRKRLRDYKVFAGVIDVADYGVPQGRKRSIIVAIRKDQDFLSAITEAGKLPWPKPTHGTPARPYATIGDWLRHARYPRLDSRSKDTSHGQHPLHFVPSYEGDRYLQVKCIPKNTGRSAYENGTCPECGHSPVPLGLVRCNKCAGLMRNRPYVFIRRKPRLISGFKSSYRRMDPDKPAATITTNSSHVGSDFKIHPWEHRVFSILECADVQTVPRVYDWSRPLGDGRCYSIRTVIGEAFPPFFTFLHGRVLRRLLLSKLEESGGFVRLLAS
jgi:DNA (cytosine-5)-methyltransferase 1